MEMMRDKITERDPREEIMTAFRLFDDDETGKITVENLKKIANEVGSELTED